MRTVFDFTNLEHSETIEESISKDAKKIHELMCVAAIIIFPIFAIFDQFTLPDGVYWEITWLRFGVTLAIATWLVIQKIARTPQLYLTYFAFSSISWFCCYACVMGGKIFLYQHNIAYCTVFLAASLFILWHWKHSLIIVASSLGVYGLVLFTVHGISFRDALLEGGAVLVTVMILHPIIIAYRYKGYKRGFQLREALRQRNDNVEIQNLALIKAQGAADKANAELKSINLNLEDIVAQRTRKLEEINTDLKEAINELDLFLYSSYHDLKGPIARLKGLSALLKHEAKEENVIQYLSYFSETIADMDALMEKLNQINIFLHHNLEPSPLDSKAFLEESTKQFLSKYKDASVEISLNGNNTLVADEIILKTALRYLIENSFAYKKFEGAHHIKMELRNNGQQLLVWDNGVGINAEILPKIFNMFYRGSTNSKGHGLGLFIAKKAMDRHRGTIAVRSELGVFTEFTLNY